MKIYRSEIDGLRAVAVISVMIYHAKIKIWGFNLLPGGFVGVDVFFVISGYLITSNIYERLQQGKFSFKEFYMRRIRRILPTLYLVMLCTIPFAWLYLLPDSFLSYTGSLSAATLFYSNYFFWFDSGYFDQQNQLKPLLHTWSLSIEEQFYFLFPIFMLLFMRKQKVINLSFTSILFFTSLIYCLANPLNLNINAQFFEPFTRMWELLVGSILAIALYEASITQRYGKVCSITGLLLIFSSICLFSEVTKHPGVSTLFPVIGTALLLAFPLQKGWVWSFLTTKIMSFVGLISYSLYLWHQPVLAYIEIYNSHQASMIVKMFGISFSVLLAILSWKFIEQPCRNKQIVSSKAILIGILSVSLFFITFSIISYTSDGLPERLPVDARNILQTKSYARRLKQNGSVCFERSVDKACQFGDSITPTWYIVGDSHAEVISSGLVPQLLNKGETVKVHTSSGCSFVPGFTRYSIKGEPSSDCTATNHNIFNNLLTASPGTVLISYRGANAFENAFFDNQEGGKESYGPYDFNKAEMWLPDIERLEQLKWSIVKSYSRLLEAGHRLILVYSIPEVGWNVPAEMLKRKIWINNNPVNTSYDIFRKRNEKVFDAFDAIGEYPNLIRLYPSKIFCSMETRRCNSHGKEGIYYSDTNHLTEVGVKMLMNELFELLNESQEVN